MQVWRERRRMHDASRRRAVVCAGGIAAYARGGCRGGEEPRRPSRGGGGRCPACCAATLVANSRRAREKGLALPRAMRTRIALPRPPVCRKWRRAVVVCARCFFRRAPAASADGVRQRLRTLNRTLLAGTMGREKEEPKKSAKEKRQEKARLKAGAAAKTEKEAKEVDETAEVSKRCWAPQSRDLLAAACRWALLCSARLRRGERWNARARWKE